MFLPCLIRNSSPTTNQQDIFFYNVLLTAHYCLFLAYSKPGDWHPYHWPACDCDWCSGEPFLGALPAQWEPAHYLCWRHVSPLGDHSLSSRLWHHGLSRQIWEHQHCKYSKRECWLSVCLIVLNSTRKFLICSCLKAHTYWSKVRIRMRTLSAVTIPTRENWLLCVNQNTILHVANLKKFWIFLFRIHI